MHSSEAFPIGKFKIASHEEVKDCAGLLADSRESAVAAAKKF